MIKPFVERYTDAGTGEQKVRINLHRGQQAAFDSAARIVAVISTYQGGKSHSSPWWLNREIQRLRHLNKGDGNFDFLAVTRSHEQLGLKFLVVLRECFEDILCIGRWWAQSKVIELADPTLPIDDPMRFWSNRPGGGPSGKMWGRIILRSAESPSSLESATALAAIADEAGDWPFASWEALQRRLSLATAHGGGRTLVVTTPYNHGFLKWRIYDRAGKITRVTPTQTTTELHPERDSGIEVIQFGSLVNPAFPKEEDEKNRRELPQWKYDMTCQGLFTRPMGVVYDCFDTQKHVREESDFKNRYWVAGLDFGLQCTAAHAGLWDPVTDHLHILFEYDAGHRSAEEHVLGIRAMNGGHPYMHVFGGSAGEEQFRTEFTLRGLRVTEPKFTSVEAGIHSAYGHIRNGNMHVHPRCEKLISDLTEMSYELAEDGQTILPKIKNKGMYHFADSYRYLRSSLTPSVIGVLDIEKYAARKRDPYGDNDRDSFDESDIVREALPWSTIL